MFVYWHGTKFNHLHSSFFTTLFAYSFVISWREISLISGYEGFSRQVPQLCSVHPVSIDPTPNRVGRCALNLDPVRGQKQAYTGRVRAGGRQRISAMAASRKPEAAS